MSNIPENIIKDMINKAAKARIFAYTPYSNFRVGAALLTKDDEIITGCNIENAAYSPGNCAERTAVFKAVSQGIKDFKGIAIVAGKDDGELEYTSPCGVCRQVLREFVNPSEFTVVMAKDENDYKIMTLEELFPMSFGPDNLR
ncbi:MAG: cytidine deaminase [Lachnospiraceae bacterium]|nr:cytidine deaminase [Lachnospiraceae bacterium]